MSVFLLQLIIVVNDLFDADTVSLSKHIFPYLWLVFRGISYVKAARAPVFPFIHLRPSPVADETRAFTGPAMW